MGNEKSSFPEFKITIQIRRGILFGISASDFIDHVLLLRQVIDHSEMTEAGPILDQCIKDYCERMANGKMSTKEQQKKLPWQIEWIWHVHRLHPVAYFNDCASQLPREEVVDKNAYKMIESPFDDTAFASDETSTTGDRSFAPSIDLTQAAIRQRDFLSKFAKHELYSHKFRNDDRRYLEQLVQNYISFIKLARKGEIIVPTFDIDLVWHTHMRRPREYHKFSIALCGFILDHDDGIEKDVLSDNYARTAYRWRETYDIAYGKDIDRKKLKSTVYQSSCAMVRDDNFYLAYCKAASGTSYSYCSVVSKPYSSTITKPYRSTITKPYSSVVRESHGSSRNHSYENDGGATYFGAICGGGSWTCDGGGGDGGGCDGGGGDGGGCDGGGCGGGCGGGGD